MKLDATALRYLTRDDFRALSALEIGSRNHECVPTALLASLARTRPGALHGRMAELAKHRLVSRENAGRGEREEGYRLTYGGYDYLALHALAQRGSVSGVGRQIGVGKESDVYLVTGDYLPESPQHGMARTHDFVLKLQRLGRTSFRTVKTNRDYLGGRRSASWMYLSRLAAEREWAFLVALHARGFPTPVPVDHSRHCVVMSWVPGVPLDALNANSFSGDATSAAAYLYDQLVSLVLRLAAAGLVHGDFNEFNILVLSEFVADPEPFVSAQRCPAVMIDFPQMVSVRHPNAPEQFARDVSCLRLFFARRFAFEPAEWPTWERDVAPMLAQADGHMDAELRASGYRGYTGAGGLALSDGDVSDAPSDIEDQAESGCEDSGIDDSCSSEDSSDSDFVYSDNCHSATGCSSDLERLGADGSDGDEFFCPTSASECESNCSDARSCASDSEFESVHSADSSSDCGIDR